ncbi:ABC-2 type transport system ATP-binding protein [Breznakia sp. PF5-3]|uniref:ABC transporter ATP-binding protein n=1 Tax=unclassified Breznakia TaxID=2623764 RepID=UPI002404BBB8|nr:MULTISPECIES: ABC transporter ATP-binding protein [unclassified Breznakia]MDL2276054.1 ABC transporter ATP-binding protein [Breznakia sp. OttesenSCG-928-G09]MDF9825503.1 ABC-2 type transport system ATP-binding protein [Breznakia sp. PM6-1]MDF9836375.1 ABC-2 type transport system ATP-binding protein [Breznakia sp. PF5-3]MDF9837491.1 ABC-2 type transport system ATP-binding protein [Breznakia sp. PFB2-8]MDF9859446.1 ABC-2 type transport system ATP-binding protein [Breznakia sp. PH5-24]
MIVEIKDLVKYYGDFKALDHFNLEVKDGEILGLLGPNGSGKTTTINCLLALLTHEEGTIKIFGKDMTASSYDIKKDIGVVMQNVAVFEELTVFQNVDYFCGLYISDRKQCQQYVEEALTFVGLNDYKKKYPKELSGGLLRRLNIACGIAHKPKLIILDEPTVAVDPQSRNHILENIQELNKKGATIVYTTHYMEEVEQLCDRIIIMDSGKEIASGTKEVLKNSIQVKEKIKFEMDALEDDVLVYIKGHKDVNDASFKNQLLEIEVTKNNGLLLELLSYFKENKIDFNKVYSETPTLNDVFLEITGKELRD